MQDMNLCSCRILTEILPKCIAFLIASHQIENGSTDVLRSIQKLNILKSLVARFYKYNYSQETLQDAVTELMTALKGKHIFCVTFLRIILVSNYIYIF